VRALLLAALALHAACAQADDPSCPPLPGCPNAVAGGTPLCCGPARLCEERVCEGLAWTCRLSPAGRWAWDRKPCPLTDARVEAPRDDGVPVGDVTCACAPGTSKPCACGQGTRACRADCRDYESECKGAPAGACEPGTKTSCPNGCGERTCSPTCSLGPCSLGGQYLKASGQSCWSPNHCGPGVGRCIECWLKCDAEGNTSKDAWCASSCQSCSPPNPSC
jgi:hypothetical protein